MCVSLDPNFVAIVPYSLISGILAAGGAFVVVLVFVRGFCVCVDPNLVSFCYSPMNGSGSRGGFCVDAEFVRKFGVSLEPNLLPSATHWLPEFWQPEKKL